MVPKPVGDPSRSTLAAVAAIQGVLWMMIWRLCAEGHTEEWWCGFVVWWIICHYVGCGGAMRCDTMMVWTIMIMGQYRVIFAIAGE